MAPPRVQSDSDTSEDDPLFDGGEDEEIDEDLAFTKEDQAKYGAWFDEEISDDDAGAGSDDQNADGAGEDAEEDAVDVDLDSSSDDGSLDGAGGKDAWLQAPEWGSDGALIDVYNCIYIMFYHVSRGSATRLHGAVSTLHCRLTRRQACR